VRRLHDVRRLVMLRRFADFGNPRTCNPHRFVRFCCARRRPLSALEH
jgi:hypothetical protein